MKKAFLFLAGLVLFSQVCITNKVGAQAFSKGAFIISLSEGSTQAHYTTTRTDGYHTKENQGNIDGDRDPLTLEYGLSKQWGIGVNLGGDILRVDSKKFYDLTTAKKQVNVITSEATVDVHYHYLVSERTDLSVFGSVGVAGVILKGREEDRDYQYMSSGSLLRLGTQARQYLTNRFGVHGMLSIYAANCANADTKHNTIATNTTTNIKGYAIEFGICYRLRGAKPNSSNKAVKFKS